MLKHSVLTIQFKFSGTDFLSVRMTNRAQMHRGPIHVCGNSSVFILGHPRVSE